MSELGTKQPELARSCASVEQLFALAQNQLPEVEAGPIRVHLETGCEGCHRRLEQLQSMIVVAAGRDLVEPSERSVHQSMRGLLLRQATRHDQHIGRIPAVLLVDSFSEARLLGFRGPGTMSRQMLYRAGDFDIDLSIDYVEPTQVTDIMGQTMPLSTALSMVAGADVKLLKESIVAVTTKTNEFGEFIIDGIPEGLYDLKLELKDEEIDILRLSTVFRPH